VFEGQFKGSRHRRLLADDDSLLVLKVRRTHPDFEAVERLREIQRRYRSSAADVAGPWLVEGSEKHLAWVFERRAAQLEGSKALERAARARRG
jgi:hypothetical protein